MKYLDHPNIGKVVSTIHVCVCGFLCSFCELCTQTVVVVECSCCTVTYTQLNSMYDVCMYVYMYVHLCLL